MTRMEFFGLALLAIFVALRPAAASAQSGDVIKIAVIDDLSGQSADRGKRITDLYKEYFNATNAAGGLTVGQRKYQIHWMIGDGQGDPKKASSEAERLITREGAAVLICPDFVCVEPAERMKTPLI